MNALITEAGVLVFSFPRRDESRFVPFELSVERDRGDSLVNVLNIHAIVLDPA